MDANKLQVKLYARDPGTVAPRALVPVFHRWIRELVLDELMLDVADYTHVHHGPGVVLVGHGSDYAYDLGEGRPGLLYSRKRALEGDLGARLADALSRARRAAELIEQDPALDGCVQFRTDELLVLVPDRLNAPNTPETFAMAAPIIEREVARAFGCVAVALEHEGTEREPLRVRVHIVG